MPEQDTPEQDTSEPKAPGLGEQEALPGGGLTAGNAVPEMPPGSDGGMGSDEDAGSDPQEPGGGLTADDLAQPTTPGDPTGDRATGLTGLRD